MKKIENLKELVLLAGDEHGEKAFLKVKAGKEVVTKTYADLKRDCCAFGAALHAQGLTGKHIAVIGPTSYEWIVTYLATVMTGGVIVPIDRELPAAEICSLLTRADVSAFVFDEMYEDAARAVLENCPQVEKRICMQKEHSGADALSLWKLLEAGNEPFDAPVANDALCAILYTSGTTGKSKGVMLSHRNLADNVTCVDMGIDADNAVLLTLLPIHHAYCFTCDILLSIYLGVTICVNDSIMHLVKNLQLFKPTLMLVVPMIIQSMYYKLNEAAKAAGGVPKPLVAQGAFGGRLKTIYSGGAYLDPKLIEGFQQFGINVVQGYGMTECAPRISSNFEDNFKAESVGKIVPGCEAKIVDGEIWVRSSSVMQGYYKDEENTAQTLTPDGWLKTGDLGHIDEDNFLYITGRKKNLIILSNGENVSPEELENHLSESPLIREVLVYEENHVITAEIFPNEDVAQAAGVTDVKKAVEGIVDGVNRAMPPFKQIHQIKIRETEFEKTTSKKIKRHYGN